MPVTRTAPQEFEMEPKEHRHLAPPPPYTVRDPMQYPVITQPAPVIQQPAPVIQESSLVIQQTDVAQQNFKDKPVLINCPSCHKISLTTIKYINSKKTHLLAGFVCGLTVWCLLCCLSVIPYMVRSIKTADHYCSNCNYYLGSYSRF